MEFDDDLLEDQSINHISFPIEVQNAIEQVLPSTDPLDQPDFNAVDYINKLFPTEQSLSNIDDVTGRTRLKIRQLEEEIRTVVRGQTTKDQDGRQALEEAQQTIQELFTRITDIKNRAEKSETMVKEITRDIKQLDYAKCNLRKAILTLEKLQMLVNGVDKLQILVSKREYKEIANLLQGVTNVIDDFQKYMAIPQIARLVDTTQNIKTQLTAQITDDFQAAFVGPNSKNFNLHRIAGACLVISILEPKVKNDLLKWFVSIQLAEYSHLFQESEDIAWIEYTKKRYDYLKRHLITFEEKFGGLFPAKWEVSERIAVEFCHITRKSLEKVMTNRKQELNVKLLLTAIEETTKFENVLSQRFTGSTLDIAPIHIPEKRQHSITGSNPFEEPDSSNPFKEDMEKEAMTNNEKTDSARPKKFVGLISQCFEPHLTIYVEFQDKNLSKQMESFVESMQKAGLPNPDRDKASILPSCSDLFHFYKECLIQCTQLSNGQPMLALASVFKKYLREYASKILQNNLPRFGNVQTTSNLIQSFLKEGEVTKFSPAEQVRICTILTTADYCLETTLQLETKLKSLIDPNLVSQVNLAGEQDSFHSVISNCIHLLVQNLESACEPALTAMNKIQWASFETVGDQSTYVTAIISHFRQILPLLRDNLTNSRKYYTQFCMKFANSFIPKLICHLFKCKSVSPVGAEQLLLDTHMLKTVLLDLPSLGSTMIRKPPVSYTKIVVKGMTKAEMILKVVMAPHENPPSFVENYVKLLPESDISEFQKVLDMKGLKRNEQVVMTELFKSQHTMPENSNLVQEKEINSNAGASTCSPEQESGRIRRLEKLIKRL